MALLSLFPFPLWSFATPPATSLSEKTCQSQPLFFSHFDQTFFPFFQPPVPSFLHATPQHMMPNLPTACSNKIRATGKRPMIKNLRKGFESPIIQTFFHHIFVGWSLSSAIHCCLPSIPCHHHLLPILRSRATNPSLPCSTKKRKKKKRKGERMLALSLS